MRSHSLPLLIAAVICCSQPAAISAAQAPTAPPQPWSLRQAVDYALENNPQTHIAIRRLEAARAASESVTTLDYPEISLVSEYSQTDTPMYSFGNILNQGAFDQSIDFNDPGRTDDLLLKAQIQYRLYDGGMNDAAVQGARARAEGAAEQLEVVHRQLAFEVVKAYHTILQAQEMRQVRKSAVEAISASVDVGRARYNAGDLLREDLLNLELQKARAVEDKIRADHRLQLTEKIFWNLLGMEKIGSFKLPTVQQDQTVPGELTIEERKELKAEALMADSARAELTQTRSSAKPTIDTFAHYQYEYGTILGESGDSWLAGIRLNYTLWNGNRTDHDSAAAKARLHRPRKQTWKGSDWH